ncbi:anthranilate synthase component I, partial [Schumannella luteola]
MTTTARAEFDAAVAAGHRVVPVLRELFADGETPVGVYRKVAADRPGTFLLESAEQGGIWSRWSFVGAGSVGVLTQRRDGEHDQAVWIDYGLDEQRAFGGSAPAAPLAAVAELYDRWRTPPQDGHP